MNFNKLYSLATNMEEDEVINLSLFTLEEVRGELEKMCLWEYAKFPPHPHFKPYYLDRIGASIDGYYRFDFVPFLQYMFTPYFLQTSYEIQVIQDRATIKLRKKYSGCEHEFHVDIVGFEVEGEVGNMMSTKSIMRRIYCLKCGYSKEQENGNGC